MARTVYTLISAGVIVLDNPRCTATGQGNTASPQRMLAPARQALAQGEYEKAAKALQEVLRADPLMPEARRLFGVCQAALGRFRGAAETWKSWARLGTLTPGGGGARPDGGAAAASGRDTGAGVGELP